MGVSIVISYHNEGQECIEECIAQIRSTIHTEPYEIIVVDDCSAIPLSLNDVKIIRHDTNKGVGAVFDTGVAYAKHDNVILTACDMRFIDNGWSEKLLKEIEEQPKSLVCTSCVVLNRQTPQNMDINFRRGISIVNGATILIFHDHKSNPKKLPSFRQIIEAKWLPHKKGDSYEVPCILGACYGVKKEWYQYIDGFWGHQGWGSLEPLISMKSYLFGGSCRTISDAETGHIFKHDGTHGITQETVLYNKILIAKLLFDDSNRLIDFLGDNFIVMQAKDRIRGNIPAISAKKEEYKSKTIFTMEEFVKKFSLDYRK
jgi:glycosyltransferase involved in cell wall biosynthesis